jgi:UDP-glucose 4-epimerase
MIARDGYAGEKVLLTGASGFIGSHLCRALRGVGAAIHAVSRKHSPGVCDGVAWWQGDLADVEWVRRLVRDLRPERIFHLAGEVTGSRTPEVVLPSFRGNLMSTVNLLTAVQETGCRRLVLAGSLEEPQSGDADAPPCSPYAAAKAAGSGYARMFHSLYEAPVVLLRIFMTYGPGQSDLQKLVPYVILSVLRGEDPRLTSGTRLVDWIYVKDVVHGILLAGQAHGIDGQTVDLGSGQLTSIREVVEMLIESMNAGVRPLFGVLPERPREQVRKANIAAAERMLQWKPETGLADGLRRTIEWYTENFSDLEKYAAAPLRSMGSAMMRELRNK